MANDHMDALPSGHRIREYEIRRVLGRGGFGITYLAHDTLLDRDVAVKEYLPTDCAVRTEDYSVRPRSSETSAVYTWGLERFLDEARMMACLDHPSIVGVHTYVELNGTGYIVMEYIEGEPLYDRLKRQGELDPFDFRLSLTAILKPLVGGLEQVHSGGYLHRDITPRNIMLKEDGTPVLTDFGSARQMVAARSRSVTAVVTPGYAPLEQYSTHGKQGPWTDIYALSAVAYRCITGTVPLDATERVQADELMLASEIGRWGYPVGLLTAVDMGLSLKSEDRPQDLTAWHEVWCKPSAGAAEWYRRAAERGRPSAQWYLGDMHATGRWAAQDDVEAVTWFRKAAEQGHILAQTHLWGMYSRGRGVAQDDVAALKWCRLAANQGDAFAQCALGVMHEKGRGVAEDDAEAVNWYRKAAEQGHGRPAVCRMAHARWRRQGDIQIPARRIVRIGSRKRSRFGPDFPRQSLQDASVVLARRVGIARDGGRFWFGAVRFIRVGAAPERSTWRAARNSATAFAACSSMSHRPYSPCDFPNDVAPLRCRSSS